jgi:hypothetical protein
MPKVKRGDKRVLGIIARFGCYRRRFWPAFCNAYGYNTAGQVSLLTYIVNPVLPRPATMRETITQLIRFRIYDFGFMMSDL